MKQTDKEFLIEAFRKKAKTEMKCRLHHSSELTTEEKIVSIKIQSFFDEIAEIFQRVPTP